MSAEYEKVIAKGIKGEEEPPLRAMIGEPATRASSGMFVYE
jgi:hypothetical protein